MTTPAGQSALSGRYRLVERIARGGMGEVWRAVDEVLDRPVAVKVLRPEYADEEIFLERFRAEARNTAALVHTGIAAVYDFGQARWGGADLPFIVMELVPGEPLSHLIERGGPLALDRALDLVAQASRALQAAHAAGLIHRDVKPANLLVTPAWAVKVTDFGIARAGDALPLTRSGTIMGTAHYLAPELVSTRGGASPVSDVYALGIVLYECLAGRRPFVGENPLAVAMAHLHTAPPPIPGIPAAVADLLDRVLAKDPRARPASAAELAHHLVSLRIDLAAKEPSEIVAGSLGPDGDPAVVRHAASRWTRTPAGHRRARLTADDPQAYDRRAAQAGPTPSAPRLSAPPAPFIEPALWQPASPGAETGPVHVRAIVRLAAPPAPAPRSAAGGSHRRARPAPHPRRPLVLGSAATLVALLVGTLWVMDSRESTAVVPAVAGTPENAASRAIKDSGFSLEVLREVNDSVPAGVVLTQTPQAGTRASTQEQISILVSSGPPAVLIDPLDWRGRDYVEVRVGLEARGLVVEDREVVTGGAPGTVTDVTPHGPVPVGEAVVVSVVVPSGTDPARAGSIQPVSAEPARSGPIREGRNQQ